MPRTDDARRDTIRRLSRQPVFAYASQGSAQQGISYREWLVGQALAGIAGNWPGSAIAPEAVEEMAVDAVAMADAVIAAMARAADAGP